MLRYLKSAVSLNFLLALWIPIWVFFSSWPYVKSPSKFAETLSLLRGSLEERRAIVYGKQFYRFLTFCKEKLPAGARFQLADVEYASIDKVRAVYFLYPCLFSEDPEFVLVFGLPGFRQEGATLLASLDEGSFILKK